CLPKARRTSSSRRLAQRSPLKLAPTAELRVLLCIESAANRYPLPGYPDSRVQSICRETTSMKSSPWRYRPTIRHVRKHGRATDLIGVAGHFRKTPHDSPIPVCLRSGYTPTEI